MTRFNAINLAELPAPDVVIPPDFETLVAERKADIVERYREIEPTLAEALSLTLGLESELIVKLVESGGYRQLLHYARVNSAARAVMLAFAAGTDLDHLGAYFGVERAVVMPATGNTPAVLETDDSLRRRIQLAPEAFAAAGPEGAYLFHVYSVDPSIASVRARRVLEVDDANFVHVVVAITFLINAGDGTPPAELIQKVIARLNDQDIKPLTDEISVSTPPITNYSVDLALQIANGPDPSAVLAKAQAAVASYVAARHEIDRPVYVNGLRAAAHVAGVENVIAASPTADVVPAPGGAAYATAINLSVI